MVLMPAVELGLVRFGLLCPALIGRRH